MYIKEFKYSGKNNSFAFKLAIFNNTCNRIDVFSKACMKAFLSMLKDLLLNYNYLNIGITGISINFDQICYLIWAYFEDAKYKKSILFK